MLVNIIRNFRLVHDRSGEVILGQVRPGCHAISVWFMLLEVMSRYVSVGLVMSGYDWIGHVRSVYDRLELVRSVFDVLYIRPG
jgi:hypothetical protein